MKMEDGEKEAARKKTIIDTPSNAFSCQNTYTYTNLHKSDVKPIVRGLSHPPTRRTFQQVSIQALNQL